MLLVISALCFSLLISCTKENMSTFNNNFELTEDNSLLENAQKVYCKVDDNISWWGFCKNTSNRISIQFGSNTPYLTNNEWSVYTTVGNVSDESRLNTRLLNINTSSVNRTTTGTVPYQAGQYLVLTHGTGGTICARQLIQIPNISNHTAQFTAGTPSAILGTTQYTQEFRGVIPSTTQLVYHYWAPIEYFNPATQTWMADINPYMSATQTVNNSHIPELLTARLFYNVTYRISHNYGHFLCSAFSLKVRNGQVIP